MPKAFKRSLNLSLEGDILKYFLDMAKLEHLLIQEGYINQRRGRVTGVSWSCCARRLDEIKSFDTCVDGTEFELLKTQPPKQLKSIGGDIAWGEPEEINSWEDFLCKSFARLRNNIVHGNKFLLEGENNANRTAELIKAGSSFIKFLIGTLELSGKFEDLSF